MPTGRRTVHDRRANGDDRDEGQAAQREANQEPTARKWRTRTSHINDATEPHPPIHTHTNDASTPARFQARPPRSRTKSKSPADFTVSSCRSGGGRYVHFGQAPSRKSDDLKEDSHWLDRSAVPQKRFMQHEAEQVEVGQEGLEEVEPVVEDAALHTFASGLMQQL